MTDYEKGLEKLGLPTHDAWLDGTGRALMDVRHDPAFAWRVLLTIWGQQRHYRYWRRWFSLCCEPKALAPTIALYAAVEEIGSEGCICGKKH